MAAKDVKFGASAREKMLKGVDTLADAVDAAIDQRTSAEIDRIFN